MRTLGIVLIALGIIAFIYTGFTYTKKEKVLDIGNIEINKEKKESVSWPPIAGLILLVAGIGVYAISKKNI